MSLTPSFTATRTGKPAGSTSRESLDPFAGIMQECFA